MRETRNPVLSAGEGSTRARTGFPKGLATVLLVLVAIAAGPAQAQMVYTWENTTSGSIPELGSNNACDGAAARVVTFDVTDHFTVSTIAVGLNLTHADRGHIRATLFAPNGASLVVLAQTAAAGDDPDSNFDVYISPASDGAGTNPKDDGTDDPIAEPYYHRLVNLATGFYTGDAFGTWTLRICDRFSAGGLGTFNRARLVLGSANTGTSVCYSTASYDWGSNGDTVAFVSGNVGSVTLALTDSTIANPPTVPTAGWNFVTKTSTESGDAGFYSIDFDATVAEGARAEASFSFNPPVRDLAWKTMDVDRYAVGGTFEDYLRVRAADGAGARVPFTVTPTAAPSFQVSSEILEGDSTSDDTQTFGNALWRFDGPVASVRTEFWSGDDFAAPTRQAILIGDPVFCAFDFGDAPASYGVTLATNGPKHVLGTREMWLGTNRPDGEADGLPAAAGANATPDNTAAIGGVNDEDGVASFPACPHTGSYTVTVSASDVRAAGADGFLVGYVDWNRDGDFADAGERSATVTVPRTNADPTNYSVTWSGVPANCGGTSAAYARFRFTTTQARAESPTDGAGVWAPDGEVEDYQISAGTLPVTIARVESEISGDALVVRWTTASEWANAGFRLLGENDEGRLEVLAEVPSVAPDSMTPQQYETVVPARGVRAIVLRDLSLFGEERDHGPFEVGEVVGLEPDTEGMKIDWAAVKAEGGFATELVAGGLGMSSLAGKASATEALLLVREEGVHRVTYEELLAAGVDLAGMQVDRIAVLNDGAGVPRHVTTSLKGRAFGAGDYVEFVARPKLSLASPFDVYVLSADRKGAVSVGDLGRGFGTPGVTMAEDRYAPNRRYSPSSPNGDPWYDQGVLALGSAASLKRTFDLRHRASGPVQLTVRTWGYGSWPGTERPDHHVVVLLNGSVIADARFDSIVPWEATVDVTGLILDTGNTLELKVPGDTGFQHDYIAFEGFSVRYPQRTVAQGGRFAGEVAARSGYSISGFDDGESVALWRLDRNIWKRGEQLATAGQVGVPTGGPAWAAAADSVLKPEIVAGVPLAATWAKEEYLIVTHPAFAEALEDLVALEESRGFATRVVTVDQIYAAYSDHAPSVEAIKRFLTTSWERGKLKYVLLVGADTTDPYNYLGLGSVSFVPTAYLPFVPNVVYSPTDEALVDANGDGLGEVPIGRLPVRTVSELREVVAKLRAWDGGASAGRRNAFLVAGASDADSNLPPLNRAYANSLDTWKTSVVAVDEQGLAAARSQLLAAMNDGTTLVSFVGHSAMGQWDFTPLFRWQDVASLTNTGRPNMVVQWGCWNAYYVEPNIESLAARLLRAPGVGSAAAIGATTLTSDESHQALGTLFFAQVNGAGGARTVGEAFRNAKKRLLASGTAKDAILGMALLGDPAMPLP